jgi:hypothetical protein
LLITENKKGRDPNKAIDSQALLVRRKACRNSKCSVTIPLFERKQTDPTNRVMNDDPTNAGQSSLP